MKIVMVNGSYKTNGVTGTILIKLMQALENYPDVSIHTIHLKDNNLAYCTGCTTCYSYGICPQDKKDNFNEVRELIANADGVIISSPNYVSAVSGLMKTFIDRMDFVTGQVLHNKYAFVISTYQNIRGKMIMNYLKEQCILAGGKVRGQLVIKADPYQKTPITDAAEREIIKQANRFYKSIKRKSKKNLIERIYSKVTQNSLRKLAVNYPSNYKGLISNWKSKGII